MLASVALFSTNCLVVKALGQSGDISFWAVNFYRSVAGCGVVLLLARKGGVRRLSRVFTRPLLVTRGLVGGIALAMFYLTLFHLDVGTASVLNLTYVLWASVFAALFLGERLGPVQVAGLAVAFAGIPLLTGFSGGEGGLYWVVAIVGAMMAGVVVMLIRYLARTEDSVTIYAAQAFYGIVVSLPFLRGEDLVPSAWAVAAMLGTGVVVASGQLVMTQAYKTMSVARGGALQLLLPGVNAVGGVVFFSEHYGWAELAGGALVLLGAYGVIRARARGLRASGKGED